MKNICLKLITLTFIFITCAATSATEFDNEFWISTNTNTANLGTLSDPFDGSTRQNLT